MTRRQRIENLILQQINPAIVTVTDESEKHQVPQGHETHIKLLVVSPQFETLTKIARHRWVNKILQEEFNQGLHALSLDLRTPNEWEASQHTPRNSPPCQRKKKS